MTEKTIFAQFLDSHGTATLMDTLHILLEQKIKKGSKLGSNSTTDLFLGQTVKDATTPLESSAIIADAEYLINVLVKEKGNTGC